MVKSRLHRLIKKVEAAVKDSDSEGASKNLHAAAVALDKAASKGVIHKNKASRKKSRLSKKVGALSASA